MGKNKRNISEVLTVIIAFTALLTSMVNVYYQFFDNYTEFNAKYTGTSVKHLKDNYDSDISFLFLNTGNTEVALISGYIYLSIDGSIPTHSFSGNRSNLDERKRKWFTKSLKLESNDIINAGKILNKKFNINISKENLLEYLNQNFDLQSNEKVSFYSGLSLNFIDSKGKLKTSNITPASISLKYKVSNDSILFSGTSININHLEMDQIMNKYTVY